VFKMKVQASCMTHTTSYLVGAGRSFFGAKAARVRLITYFPLVLRPRMGGAVPPFMSVFS